MFSNINIKESIRAPLVLVFIAVTAYFLKYALDLLLARSLSSGLYGDVKLSLKLLKIAAVILILGASSSANRFMSRYFSSNDYNNSYQHIHWNLTFIFKSIIFLCFIVIHYSLNNLLRH